MNNDTSQPPGQPTSSPTTEAETGNQKPRSRKRLRRFIDATLVENLYDITPDFFSTLRRGVARGDKWCMEAAERYLGLPQKGKGGITVNVNQTNQTAMAGGSAPQVRSFSSIIKQAEQRQVGRTAKTALPPGTAEPVPASAVIVEARPKETAG